MFTINITETKEVIAEIAVRLREPLMLWGQPGAGKSDATNQVCTDFSGVMCDVRLSQYDSVDVRGIPVPSPDGLTVWHAPSTLPFKGNPEFDEQGPLIFLFLDEITSAASSVAAVAYQLIQDRAVGEHKLMDNVVVIAAGNRDGDRGVTNKMPTPLANRFIHVEVGIDADVFCEYAVSKDVSPVGIAFIQFRKPLLSTFDPSKPDKAFATPRTWMKAFRCYADNQMSEDVKRIAIAGAVGEGPAAEFWGFVDTWKKVIPISRILADPEGCELPSRDEIGMIYATAVSVSGNMSPKTITPLYTYLQRLDPEFVALAWQLALKRDSELYTVSEFTHFAEEYAAIFKS